LLSRRQKLIAVVCLVMFVCCSLGAAAKPVPSLEDDKAADYKQEPFVLDEILTKVAFENDGTYVIEQAARGRIQSQAGLQGFGILNFPYASAIATLDVLSVRVFKPDGRIVETPAENVLDMPTEITREAPFYSDLKEKQVAVKGLEIGDSIEYKYRVSVKTPLDPGQFWFTFNFFRSGICLREILEISVPRGRSVKTESAKVQATISDAGINRVYTWTTDNLIGIAGKKDSKALESDEGEKPSVQLTTFQNWDEVGQWFKALIAPRALPTKEIQDRAQEITRNARTDEEKIRAIYEYVSTKYRYIGIALGIGRYQPHAAADVLSNGYGDCKDKHTLFEALLAAENIKAYPALINSTAKIQPDVPSPQQFDHMITAVPQGEGFLFLDTTAEVAPYGYLVAALRDKDALVIPDKGAPKLVRTQKDPPFKSQFHFQADGTLDDSGTLECKVRIIVRTDEEILYRLAFRRAGQSQWKEVMQQISSNLGFGGTVSDVTVIPPDDTSMPFQIDYTYSRKTYGDWDNRRIISPFPLVFLPVLPEDFSKNSKPLKLGQPTEYVLQGSIKLPPNSNPNVRPAVDLLEPFAEYHSKYSVENGVIHFDRRVVTRTDEVEIAKFSDYAKFVKVANDDEGRFIALNGDDDESGDVDVSPEAQKLYSEGAKAWNMQDIPSAADSFRRAVEIDPKFSLGWMELGRAHFVMGEQDQGIDEMKKAISLNPTLRSYYKVLAPVLIRLHRQDEALELWKELEKQRPGDADAATAIGGILIEQKKYAEAIAELSIGAKANPDDGQILMQMGEAYVHNGNKEKGIAALEAAAKPPLLNDVAFILADNNLQLQEALGYAQKAVAQAESDSAAITLDDLKLKDLQSVKVLAAYWDTLGWVNFRLGQIKEAESYLNAAWRLNQESEIADHLGQVYEAEGKKHDAMVAYSGAVAAGHASDHSHKRLDELERVESRRTGQVDVLALQDQRTINLEKFPNKPSKHASAEFFVLLAPGPKIAAVKFISGSEDLRGANQVLSAAQIDAVFPDDHPARILRRGVLDCEPEVPGCVFVLFPPNDVRSVN
jgi:tetratricopeptide (TPR) repeat protein